MPLVGVWRIQDAVARRRRHEYVRQVNACRAAQLQKDDYEDHIHKVMLE